MGGIPKTAMNIVCFPLQTMDISVLREILQGGLDKMEEAGVVLVGGHSVEDTELKYGLSVTGFIHPNRILIKNNLKVNDSLILTKPLGVGIINTAIKAGLAESNLIKDVTKQMAELNKAAAEVMTKFPVNACTDITGFGLIGHLAEMLNSSSLSVNLFYSKIPVIYEAISFAKMGLVPGGAYKNREFREHMVHFASSIDIFQQDILFDPQTSGGLLIAIQKEYANDLVNDLLKKGIKSTSIIGEIIDMNVEKIFIY